MTVYVVFKRTCEDYHGCSDEIVNIYSAEKSARDCIEDEERDNFNCNIDFHFEAFSVN